MGAPMGLKGVLLPVVLFLFLFFTIMAYKPAPPPAPPLLPPSPSVCACVCTQRPEVDQNVPAHIAFHGDAGVRTRVLALV